MVLDSEKVTFRVCELGLSLSEQSHGLIISGTLLKESPESFVVTDYKTGFQKLVYFTSKSWGCLNVFEGVYTLTPA